MATEQAPLDADVPDTRRGRRGRRPLPVVEQPVPTSEKWKDPAGFREAFDLHLRRHSESIFGLHRALKHQGCKVDYSTLRTWRIGSKEPSTVHSFDVLCRIEERYRLPSGYFQAKLGHPARSVRGVAPSAAEEAERRRLAWHLPHDFNRRPLGEQAKILAWIREVVISGATDYRRYQRTAMKHRFALSFARARRSGEVDHPLRAPKPLVEEMAALLSFKTSAMTQLGYRRRAAWSGISAKQREAHLSLLFGALAASPTGPIAGCGVPREALGFGLLAFPQTWDWYLRWRETRRGFFTKWEVDMLVTGALAMSSPETGWLTQTPRLAERLIPVEGLVTEAEVEAAQADWGRTCAQLHA